MPNPLALSPSSICAWSVFGAERQPLLIVDDCLPDPGSVVEIAARHAFAPIGPFYPGVRAAVSERVAMPLVAPLLGDIRRGFALDRDPGFLECFLSVVTVAPEELAPIQRLPHFDGVEPGRIAVLLYLDRAERGGTAFYRQRSTGYESVTEPRFDTYRDTLNRETARLGLPEPGYIAGDTAMFERIHLVEGSFNRMAIYRGNTVHCAALDPDFVPEPNPALGRLTLNLFLSAPTE